MEKLNIYQKLLKIQIELKAPKNQYNNFGKYNYRSCEDILEALKPLLEKYNVVQMISDKLIQGNDKNYIEATIILINADNPDEQIQTTALARESVVKKGMDDSQITGSTSSYARKYALNGLYAIDDTKDADTKNNNISNDLICINCNDEIKNTVGTDGKQYVAAKVKSMTKGLCIDCFNKTRVNA